MGAVAFVLGAIMGLIGSVFVPHQDPGTRLLLEAGPQIFMITPPSNTNSGGTGFSFRAPSGRVYTITNAHVCEVAEDGQVAVHSNDASQRYVLKVIQVYDKADLCLIDGVPGASGLKLASDFNAFDPVYALGHPLLEGNTLTRGYPTGRRIITVGDFIFSHQRDAILTSVVIFPGNSGSPALNEDGEVVGVFFAGDGRSNYGAMVPFDILLEFVATR